MKQTHLIIEIQTSKDGTVGNIVTAYEDEPQAVSKFHTVMAAAALSDLPCHACVHMLSDGGFVNSGCFHHGTDEGTDEVTE